MVTRTTSATSTKSLPGGQASLSHMITVSRNKSDSQYRAAVNGDGLSPWHVESPEKPTVKRKVTLTTELWGLLHIGQNKILGDWNSWNEVTVVFWRRILDEKWSGSFKMAIGEVRSMPGKYVRSNKEFTEIKRWWNYLKDIRMKTCLLTFDILSFSQLPHRSN